MIRERIGQAALRAYPPAVRQARGPEMLGMLLDAGEQSNRALVRESGSLVLGGLRERRALAARAGTRRLIADACCQAVLIFLMLWLISALNTQVITGPTQRLFIQEVVLVAIVACALVGYERIAAVGGLAVLIAFTPIGEHIQPVGPARMLVPIACLLVMVCAPRRRPHDPRRLLWLLPVGVLAALHAHAYVSLAEVLAVMSVGGLLRLLHDPRLAIACSLVWITLLLADAARQAPAGLRSLVIQAAVACGLILTVAAWRLWIMRHSTTA
ncbi:MAG: hypothetical protein ACLPV4_23345 [Solirubrobacteraceae bacterium]